VEKDHLEDEGKYGHSLSHINLSMLVDYILYLIFGKLYFFNCSFSLLSLFFKLR
jgi:hypothetical protein